MSEPYVVVGRDLPRDRWLIRRRECIGSSVAAAAMHMSPWTSAYAAWCELSGLLPDSEPSEAMVWGQLLEPLIVAQGVERGWYEPPATGLLLRSTRWPWLGCSPDGLCPDCVVEAKSAHAFAESEWDSGLPDHYAIQGAVLMAVTGRPEVRYPVLFGGSHLALFVMKRDPELEARVVEATEAFWRRVQDNDPPDPDGSESSMLALRSRYGWSEPTSCVELGPEWSGLLAQREQAMSAQKAMAGDADRIKALAMSALGSAEAGTLGGQVVVTWRPRKDGVRVVRFPERKEQR